MISDLPGYVCRPQFFDLLCRSVDISNCSFSLIDVCDVYETEHKEEKEKWHDLANKVLLNDVKHIQDIPEVWEVSSADFLLLFLFWFPQFIHDLFSAILNFALRDLGLLFCSFRRQQLLF